MATAIFHNCLISGCLNFTEAIYTPRLRLIVRLWGLLIERSLNRSQIVRPDQIVVDTNMLIAGLRSQCGASLRVCNSCFSVLLTKLSLELDRSSSRVQPSAHYLGMLHLVCACIAVPTIHVFG